MAASRRQHGHALTTTMAMIAFLTPLGAFAVLQARLDLILQHNVRTALETFVVAESGLEHALADFERDPRFGRLLAGADTLAGTADDGQFPFIRPPPAFFPQAPFRYDVRVTAQRADLVEVVARAFGPGSAVRSVAASVAESSVPALPAGLHSAAPSVSLMIGSEFRIDGGTDLPALAVDQPETADAVAAQLTPAAAARVVGAGGSPSIGVARFAAFDGLAAAASGWPGAEALGPEMAGTFGEGIFTAAGTLRLADAAGSGILVVNGDLDVSDRFAFAGLVLVRGNLRVDPTARLEIDGAVLQGRGGVLQLLGAGSIRYDPAALARVDAGWPGFLPRRGVVTGWHDRADEG